MALTVTIEDGSVVPNANTYATVAYVRAYNGQRGIELDDDDDVVIAQMVTAMDYIEAYEPRWSGNRVQPLFQSLSWPRSNALLYDNLSVPIPNTMIPVALKSAQAYLVSVVSNGTDLYAVQDSRAVTKEVIGPLETDYSVTGGATLKPIIPNLDAILASLFRSGSTTLKSTRV